MSNPSLDERSAPNGHVSISGTVNRGSVAAYCCTISPLISEVLIWLRNCDVITTTHQFIVYFINKYNFQIIIFAVVKKPGDNLSTMLQYDDVKEMWQYFTLSGLPGQGKCGPSPVSSFLCNGQVNSLVK